MFFESTLNVSLIGGFGGFFVVTLMVGACYFAWHRRKGATPSLRATVRRLLRQGEAPGVAVDLEEVPPVEKIARDLRV